MTRMKKVELYVMEYNDDLDIETMKEFIEQSLDRISVPTCGVRFGDIQEKDIGEWHDDIKFNKGDTPIGEFRKEFGVVKDPVKQTMCGKTQTEWLIAIADNTRRSNDELRQLNIKIDHLQDSHDALIKALAKMGDEA